MKYIYTLFFLLAFISSIHGFTTIPKELENEVALLMRYPETRVLIDRVEQKGGISLKWLTFGNKNFQAFWMGPKRTIGLNSDKTWKPGEKIYSLLFELHNAATDPTLFELDRQAKDREIGKEAYIRAVETIEYQNAMDTQALIKKGVMAGYFPRDFQIPVYPSLEEHLRFQKASGHSTAIANKYDDLSPQAIQ